jgi:uncharacterized repeat protein (TIGR04138 family)
MPREPRKSIDEVIRDLGRYPAEAFAFIQECIGLAADQVHAPMTPDEVKLAQWMAQQEVSHEELEAQQMRGDLPPEVMGLVERVGGSMRMNRHVSGQQLCWAVRDAALQRWGFMARSVLTRWNIRRTADIGQIIFALVENDLLQKQPADSIEDFNDVFDFETALEHAYQIGS